MSRFLRICNQSLQKVLIRAKKIFVIKNSIWVLKNAEFLADFESVEKVWKKMHNKKVISKNVTQKGPFSLFTHVRQTCFAYNFFCVQFFTTFSTDSKSAWNSAFFDTFFYFVKKKIFLGHISTFFELWLQMRRKRFKKTENLFLWMCLRILLGNHQRVCISKLLKSLYPSVHQSTWIWFIAVIHHNSLVLGC